MVATPYQSSRINIIPMTTSHTMIFVATISHYHCHHYHPPMISITALSMSNRVITITHYNLSSLSSPSHCHTYYSYEQYHHLCHH